MHFRMMALRIVPHIQGLTRVCYSHDYKTVTPALKHRCQLSYLWLAVRNCSEVKDSKLTPNCGTKSEQDTGDFDLPVSRTDSVPYQNKLSKGRAYIDLGRKQSTFKGESKNKNILKANRGNLSHSDYAQYQNQIDRISTDKRISFILDKKDTVIRPKISPDLEISDEVMTSSEKYPGDDYFKVSKECLESLTEEQHNNFQIAVERTKSKIKRAILTDVTPEIPSHMTDERWMAMMERSTKSSWLNNLKFFCMVDKKRANNKLKKEEQRKMKELTVKEEDEPTYDSNNIAPLKRKYGFRMHYTQRGLNALIHGAHFVVDMRYFNHMNIKETSLTHQQLLRIVSDNRTSRDPFHLVFCNAKEGHTTVKELNSMWGLHECVNVNYNDLYPREQLVYLSPHSENVLETYSHEDIYIVGAIVDKTDTSPRSMTVATEDGIRTASLPLYEYLGIGGEDGVLTLDQVMKIMMDLKDGKSWETLLREHIPTRITRRFENKYRKLKHQQAFKKNY